MHILNEGRGSYLEFLRNLGPQVLIMVVAIISGVNYIPTCCYPENFWATFFIVCIWTTWTLAVIANVANFITNFTDSVVEFKDAHETTGITVWERIKLLWSKRKSFFFELILVFLVAEVGMVAVVFTGISTAAGLLNNLHLKM